MNTIIKQFVGFSNSSVYLMKNKNQFFVRKIDNVDRNYNQLRCLKKFNIDVPSIYNKTEKILDMEYIDGMDMKNYIISYGVENLFNFFTFLVNKFQTTEIIKNYSEIYKLKLSWMPNKNEFVFTKKQLLSSLPKYLPSSMYHGDLTLQNIIYSKSNKFYLIDASTIEYDSWVFDLAKLRQDVTCKWFIRNENNCNLDSHLKLLEDKLLTTYPLLNNNSLLILMLLRVYLYAKKDSTEQIFLKSEINKLWK